MAFTFSVILVLSVLRVVLAEYRDLTFDFFSDDAKEYDDTKIAQTSFSSLLVKCEHSQGVCIQAVSCPWNRLLADDDNRCLLLQTDYVCCKVAQVRMPVDLFAAYGI